MSREYNTEKEYTFWEIIRYNLRMWWLAVIMAILCAAALGGYKYKELHPLVEKEIYENKQQVVSSFYVKNYSDAGMTERVANIVKIAKSRAAYLTYCKEMGDFLTMDEYTKLFEYMQGESSDVVSLYVTFPVKIGEITIEDEETALKFAKAVMNATEEVSEKLIGSDCLSIMDEPYVIQETVKVENYSISQDDFKQAILKALTAGVLLGIIVEVVLYTFWMLIYRKPKNADEVRQILDANIIDEVVKEDNENTFKNVALYLKNENKGSEIINCIPIQCARKDVALKLAMSYASEQKKTLYIDLGSTEGNKVNSISKYILGEEKEVHPIKMNTFLDSVCRNQLDENGMDIVSNERFKIFVEEMCAQYNYIILNNQDSQKNIEAYAVSKLADKSFIVCGRKNVTNEMLYRMKNTADINGIKIDGVLVYDV